MSLVSLSEKELELYRLLEYANLSQYFTNFLAKGGDDVSQLTEATKDEFNEIIELVGMVQKPLHIRRLQKALKDWLDRRNEIMSINTTVIVPQAAKAYLKVNQKLVPFEDCNQSANDLCRMSSDFMSTFQSNIFMSDSLLTLTDDEKDINYSNGGNGKSIPSLFNNNVFSPPSNNRLKPIDVSTGIPVSLLPNAVLNNYEKCKIRLAAKNLAQTLPAMEVRSSSTGRKDVNKKVLNILSMPKDHPDRENQIYNYSAIYGRFNAPRRTGKPMNHHEVSVNEAAAQLSLQIPELITQRDNLFHLARQVVKMAEEIHDDSMIVTKQEFCLEFKEEQSISENPEWMDIEKQIIEIKSEIESLLAQESNIRDSYKEAKLNSHGLLMNELQKRLDETLNQLNNKFTLQTALATKRMLLRAGSITGDGATADDPNVIKADPDRPLCGDLGLNIHLGYMHPAEEDATFQYVTKLNSIC